MAPSFALHRAQMAKVRFEAVARRCRRRAFGGAAGADPVPGQSAPARSAAAGRRGPVAEVRSPRCSRGWSEVCISLKSSSDNCR